MKKLFTLVSIVAIMLLSMAFVSCDSCTGPTSAGEPGDSAKAAVIQFDVNVEALTDGFVFVEFPFGNFQADGKAEVKTHVSNVTAERQLRETVTLESAKESKDEELKEAADKLDTQLEGIKVKEAIGTYCIKITGKALEPNTGIVLTIDKVITNIPPND